MTEEDNHLSLAQSSASDVVLTLEPCTESLEELPPEYVEKLQRCPEAEGRMERGESDSDSGNSLFITQKPGPQLARSRKTRYKLQLEEHEDDSSSSSSSDEPVRKKKRKKFKPYKLPEYSFPFLPRKPRHFGNTKQQDTGLHNTGMTGFLRLVKELCEGSQTRKDVESPLPAEGTDEDNISPLTEEETEESEAEDIKVVERKLFAVQIKSKSQQTWCSHLQQKNTRNAANVGQDLLQDEQFQAHDEEPATTNSLMIEAEEVDLATTPGNSPQQPDTQVTERLPEEEEGDGDAPCSEQTMTVSNCVEGNVTLVVTENLDSDFNVEISASLCAENGDEKIKKKHGSAEDVEQLESGTVPETQNDEANNRRKKKKRKKEKEIITEEERGEEENSLEASQQILEFRKKKHFSGDDAAQEDECTGVGPLSTQSESEERSAKKKKKRKINLEEADNSPDLVENTNNEHFDNTQNISAEDQISEIVIKKKKKKRRKRESCSGNEFEQDSAQVSAQEGKTTSSFISADEGSLQSVEAPVVGVENDKNVDECNDGVRKKKKKRKKESCCENSKQGFAQGDDSVSAQEGKTTSSFISADAGSLQSVEAPAVGAENNKNVDECNDGVRKKKKKRKKESCCENSKQSFAQGDDSVSVHEKERTLSFLSADTGSLQSVEAPVTGAENDRNVDECNDGVRKKKKKRKRESCCENSEQGFAQGDDSMSVQEKERTSSFLTADAESSLSVEAPAAGAEKLSEDAPGLEKDPAENDTNECDDGVRKKKKKKKKKKKRKVLEMDDGVEKDQEQELEEANTSQSVLSGGDGPGVERRQKQKGNELMTPVESLEGAVVAGPPSNHETTVLKKKKKKKKKSKDETCHEIQQSPTAATEELDLFNVTFSTKSVNLEPDNNENEERRVEVFKKLRTI
ncbi:uncharacterized protein LOC141791320 [Halichoeres trimaculatus]|uniref:uncharacterized protein LOC141791320 n=1 Tax=Halichoeres trimaculatus TaxID=147232 RepID=UPI003D9F2332